MHKSRLAGFSLVELLTTVAVLGILAALSIPAITRVSDRAASTAAKRNAQEAAALSAAANSMGINHVVSEVNGGVIPTLELLSNGIEQLDETGILVQLSLSDQEMTKAATFLKIQENDGYSQLIYAGDTPL